MPFADGWHLGDSIEALGYVENFLHKYIRRLKLVFPVTSPLGRTPSFSPRTLMRTLPQLTRAALHSADIVATHELSRRLAAHAL
jgi:hypothetical protein